MQMIRDAVRISLSWESIRLPNGAYRIQNSAILCEVPDITEFIDCSYCYRFLDELSCVRMMHGAGISTKGLWIGRMKPGDHFVKVIGLYVAY